MEELIFKSSHSQIKTFHITHTWTIDNIKHFLDDTQKERLIDSKTEKCDHFTHFLRLNIEPPGDPYVELHIQALKDVKFDISFKVALLGKDDHEVKDAHLDWTTKPLKLATGKTDFFQGIDINVSKVKASNPEVFTENKFKIKCEVKFIADKQVFS